MSSVSCRREPLAGFLCVRGHVAGNSFSLLCLFLQTDGTHLFPMSFNIIKASLVRVPQSRNLEQVLYNCSITLRFNAQLLAMIVSHPAFYVKRQLLTT